jgi:hypothetical protein
VPIVHHVKAAVHVDAHRPPACATPYTTIMHARQLPKQAAVTALQLSWYSGHIATRGGDIADAGGGNTLSWLKQKSVGCMQSMQSAHAYFACTRKAVHRCDVLSNAFVVVLSHALSFTR